MTKKIYDLIAGLDAPLNPNESQITGKRDIAKAIEYI